MPALPFRLKLGRFFGSDRERTVAPSLVFLFAVSCRNGGSACDVSEPEVLADHRCCGFDDCEEVVDFQAFATDHDTVNTRLTEERGCIAWFNAATIMNRQPFGPIKPDQLGELGANE